MRTRGFTLIEMLVSVAIFSLVMVIALGALLTLSTSDRKAESLKAVVNNLNFSIDSMVRAMRTGYNYNCGSSAGGNCTLGGSSIYFTPASGGTQVAYRLENDTTDPSNAATICGQSGNVGCIARSTDDGNTWYTITSPNVVINPSGTILFYLIGAPQGLSANGGDSIQPKIAITLSGTVQVTPTETSVLHVQTSVTQRLYDH